MIRHRFFLGLDLGEVKDFTAFAAIEVVGGPGGPLYRLIGLERFKSDVNTEILDRVSDSSVSLSYWDRVVRYLARHLRSHQFHRNSLLGIDATGIGRPVVRMMLESPMVQETGTPIYPFEFRGNGSREYQRQNGLIQITRRTVLSSVQIVMGQGRLRIPEKLREAEVLRRELLSVRIEEGRQDHLDERTREHDDMVFAVALPVHLAETLAKQGVGGWVPVRYA